MVCFLPCWLAISAALRASADALFSFRLGGIEKESGKVKFRPRRSNGVEYGFDVKMGTHVQCVSSPSFSQSDVPRPLKSPPLSELWRAFGLFL